MTGRDAEEYQRLLNLPAYQEVKAMELTWGDKMIEQGRNEGRLEGLRGIVLRQMERRFGSVPESVRRRAEAMDSTDSLTEVADKLLDAGSIDEMGLS